MFKYFTSLKSTIINRHFLNVKIVLDTITEIYVHFICYAYTDAKKRVTKKLFKTLQRWSKPSTRQQRSGRIKARIRASFVGRQRCVCACRITSDSHDGFIIHTALGRLLFALSVIHLLLFWVSNAMQAQSVCYHSNPVGASTLGLGSSDLCAITEYWARIFCEGGGG